MSAERLREAAAWMRSNAEKAEPGRWKLWGMTVMADPTGTSNVDSAINVAHAYTPSTTSQRLHTGNADHIASWHPAVALAVADWLEDEALGETNPDTGGWLNPHALALADTYLGVTP